MTETLRSILEKERARSYIEVKNKEFSNEIIQFKKELILDSSFSNVIFTNNKWIKLVVGRTDFSFSEVISSVWLNCFFDNVSFGPMDLVSSKVTSSVFSQCRFEGAQVTNTIFYKCSFLEGSLAGATFKSCEFIDTQWKLDFITGTLIDSQFTNSSSKKSIKFDEETYFIDIQDQINNID